MVNTAHLCGHSKTHKPAVSFCTIVCNIGTASYPIAPYVSHIFSPLSVNNTHTARNAFDFVNKLKSFSPLGFTVLSLDVKSLFINHPVEGVLNCLEKY